jgi:hypothetical protein
MTTRTRRRLIITALVVAALVAIGWLLTPRIDRRLVGDWVNVDPAAFAAWRTFNADGTIRYASDSTNTLPPGGGFWSVSGKTLIFSQRSAVPFAGGGSIRRWVYDIINRFRLGPGIEHYTILEVTPDTLRIQSHSGAPLEVYRRK